MRGSKYIEEERFQHFRPHAKNILRKVFLEDWLTKLFALVITFALWIGVTGLSKPTQQRMNGVPLSLRFSNNIEVTNETIQEVDIVISGDKRKIDQINRNDLLVSLDLTDTPPGERVVQLTPDNVSIPLPNGVKLDEIQPRRIAVKIESVEVKEIPVNVLTEGQVADAFEVYSEESEPAKVQVRGPSSYIKSLSSISTERIDLTNRSSNFSVADIPLNVTNPKAVIQESGVSVTIKIGERRVERTLQVAVKDQPKRKLAVTLFGPKSLIESVENDEVQVNFSETDAGKSAPIITLSNRIRDKIEVKKPKLDR